MTPLGVDVEPEVNCRNTTSSEQTSERSYVFLSSVVVPSSSIQYHLAYSSYCYRSLLTSKIVVISLSRNVDNDLEYD